MGATREQRRAYARKYSAWRREAWDRGEARLCYRCKVVKPHLAFTPTDGWCKPCRRAYESSNKANWPSRHPYRMGMINRKTQYGIDDATFVALVLASEGRCATCGRPERRMHVDHDHETGVVRGLICGDCNHVLGRVRDDADVLRALADYLDRHK